MNAMPAGLHIVSKRKPGKPIRWYVYAWRGGPQIFTKEGGQRPAITSALTDAALCSKCTKAAASVIARNATCPHIGG